MTITAVRQPWMDDAVCRQTDPDLWFPEMGRANGAAKRICRSCPVVEECLAFALEHDERGIWGGTSDRERAAIARARGAA